MSRPSFPVQLESQTPTHNNAWLDAVQKAATSIRFGFIQIKIHDGAVVQIEAAEKYQLEDFSSQTNSQPTEPSEA